MEMDYGTASTRLGTARGTKARTMSKPKHNAHASLLFARAGNAGARVVLDTRPKTVRPRKGIGSYRRQAKHRSAGT